MKPRADWEAALAAYTEASARVDVLPVGTPGEDDLVELAANAMDRLIVDTPAPDLDAVHKKALLAFQRCDGLAFFEDYRDAILADLRRLGAIEASRFDPKRWIEEAEAAGAAMFVRNGELWVGQLVALSPTRQAQLDQLKAALGPEERDAVRDYLASRGLICEDA